MKLLMLFYLASLSLSLSLPLSAGSTDGFKVSEIALLESAHGGAMAAF